MARMMDSLILDQYPPFAFTKITTTHRPTKAGNIKKTETTRTTSMGGLVPPQTSTGLGIRLKNRIPTQGLERLYDYKKALNNGLLIFRSFAATKT